MEAIIVFPEETSNEPSYEERNKRPTKYKISQQKKAPGSA